MRTLIVTQSYLPVLGGLQTVVNSLSEGLLKRGHSIRVITNRYPIRLRQHEVINNIEITRLHFIKPKFSCLSSTRFDLFVAGLLLTPITNIYLKREVATFKPDVINVHFPDIVNKTLLWLKNSQEFRLVVSLHGHEILRWTSPEGLYIKPDNQLNAILHAADKITACSQYLLTEAVKLAPSIKTKSVVVYNGIDLSRFQIPNHNHNPKKYILSYGRLTRKKGFDLLLQAFARVVTRFPYVDLLIAGDGEENKALQKLAEELGLQGRVQLIGIASPETVVKLLNGCLFVVIPSRQEPFGIVALEALASGKPVIASRVGGLPEVLDGTQAVMVEPNVASLTNAITNWLEHPVEWDVELAVDCARRFRWESCINQYEAVLKGDL